MQEVRLFVCTWQASGRAASDPGVVLDPRPDTCRDFSRSPIAGATAFPPSAEARSARAGKLKGGAEPILDRAYDS